MSHSADRRPLVLIVEDDLDISRTLTMRLEMHRFRVNQAFNAGTAMESAKRERPDLVLMEVSVPGGDGFEIADRLANDPDSAGLPVIFLTASMRSDLPARALMSGAAAFLRKPYDSRTLISEVKRLTDTEGCV